MPRFVDSLGKVMGVYLASVVEEPFEWRFGNKKRVVVPKDLYVSPLLLRGYNCPPNCGACCPRFSLDYLPGDTLPYELKERFVSIGGKLFPVYSDMQEDHREYHCRNLDKVIGRCKIHSNRPFSCDFELIRFLVTKGVQKPNLLAQKLFGRGHAMRRFDGVNKGALCEITPVTLNSVSEVIRKFKGLLKWADYFELKTCIPYIIDWIESLKDGDCFGNKMYKLNRALCVNLTDSSKPKVSYIYRNWNDKI